MKYILNVRNILTNNTPIVTLFFNPPVPAYSNEGGRPDFIRILILSGVQDDARPSSGVTGLCTDLIMIISDTPAIELHLD